MGRGQQIFLLSFQIQESIPHPGPLPRSLQRSQRRCAWVPHSQGASALGRWDLSGPFSHNHSTKSTAHLLSSPLFSPSRSSSFAHPQPPTLRGVGKLKGGWVSCLSWQRAVKLDKVGHGNCLGRRGQRLLDGWWLWDCGQRNTSSSRAGPGSDSQKSKPGPPGVEAEAPPRPAPHPQEEAQALRIGWAQELAGTVRS